MAEKRVDEFDDEGFPQQRSSKHLWVFVLVGVMAVGCCVVSVVAAIVIPSLQPARVRGSEAAAKGSLRTLCTCQTLYYERNNQQYATSLNQLRDDNLIDAELATGTKYDYEFEIFVLENPQKYEVLASPGPNLNGALFFKIDETGVLYSRTSAKGDWKPVSR